MFTKLLVPLDCSVLAEQALAQAAAIARSAHATMELVYVHQRTPFEGLDVTPWPIVDTVEIDDYLRSLTDELSSGASISAKSTILQGEPVETLCRHIVESETDLVVMTSHGRTGLSRVWLGSVADGVLRHASVPVLMLRPLSGRTRHDAARRLFKRILVPLDGSALAAEILKHVEALAKCGNARIWLLRVVQPVPQIAPESGIPYAGMAALIDDPSTTRLVHEAEEQLADVGLQLRQQTGLEIETHVVVEPRVAPAIVDFSRIHDIDVVAMSTHGRGMSRFLVGSVADKVMRASLVPLLMYRPIAVQSEVPLKMTGAELGKVVVV